MITETNNLNGICESSIGLGELVSCPFCVILRANIYLINKYKYATHPVHQCSDR